MLSIPAALRVALLRPRKTRGTGERSGLHEDEERSEYWTLTAWQVVNKS